QRTVGQLHWRSMGDKPTRSLWQYQQIAPSIPKILKQIVPSIRSPITATLLRGVVPAGQQSMQTSAVAIHLPQFPGTIPRIDYINPELAAVRGKPFVGRRSGYGRQFLRVATITFCQVEIGAPQENTVLSVR